MKAQLTINGQTVEVELSAEQLQQLGVEEKRASKRSYMRKTKHRTLVQSRARTEDMSYKKTKHKW